MPRFFLTLVITYSLFPNHSVASDMCTTGKATFEFREFSSATPYAVEKAATFMKNCYLEAGKAYKESSSPTALKNSMKLNDVYSVLKDLIEGEYTQNGSDEKIIKDTKTFADRVFQLCSKSQIYIDASSVLEGPTGDSPVAQFVKLCGQSYTLSQIDFVRVSSLLTPLAGDEAACASGVVSNALACARLCSDAGRPSAAACTNFNEHGEGKFAGLSGQCAAGDNTACQKACELEPASCKGFRENDLVAASVDPNDTDSNPIGSDDDYGGGGDGYPSDPTSGGELTNADSEKLSQAASQLGQNMFGGGMGMGMMNSNFSPSNVPKSDPSSNASTSGFEGPQGLGDPRIASVPSGSVHLPLSNNLPTPTEGRPGLRPNPAGDTATGGGASSSPMIGGGGMGGVASGGGGGGGNGAKGPRGGYRESAWQKIADALGGNNYMGTDGAPGGAKTEPAKSALPQILKNKIAQNNEAEKARARVNAMFHKNLPKGVGAGQMYSPFQFPSVDNAFDSIYKEQKYLSESN